MEAHPLHRFLSFPTQLTGVARRDIPRGKMSSPGKFVKSTAASVSSQNCLVELLFVLLYVVVSLLDSPSKCSCAYV